MFETIRKEIFYAVLTLVLTAAASYLYTRYTFNEVDVTYTLQNIKLPEILNQKINVQQQVSKLKAMRLVVKNQMEKPITISSIEIYGVRAYLGSNGSLLSREEELSSLGVTAKHNQNEGKLLLTNFSDLPPKQDYEISILGDFFPTFVQVNSGLGLIAGREASIVSGTDLLFARHWPLALIVFILSIVLVVYYYKSRNVQRNQ